MSGPVGIRDPAAPRICFLLLTVVLEVYAKAPGVEVPELSAGYLRISFPKRNLSPRALNLMGLPWTLKVVPIEHLLLAYLGYIRSI